MPNWLLDNVLDEILPTCKLGHDFGWQQPNVPQALSVVPIPDGDGWRWRVPLVEPFIKPDDLKTYEPLPEGDDLIFRYLNEIFTKEFGCPREFAEKYKSKGAPLSGNALGGKLLDLTYLTQDEYFNVCYTEPVGQQEVKKTKSLLSTFVGNVNLKNVGYSVLSRDFKWKALPYDNFALKQMFLSLQRRLHLSHIIRELAKTPYILNYFFDEKTAVYEFAPYKGALNRDIYAYKEFNITDANNDFLFKDTSSCCYGWVDQTVVKDNYVCWVDRFGDTRWLYNKYMDDVPATPWSRDLHFSSEFTQVISAALHELVGRGIPPFKIPDRFGGGEKYIYIYGSESGVIKNDAIANLSEEILFVPVSSSLLNAHSVPVWKKAGAGKPILPVYPEYALGISYLFGYPGVFKFLASRDKGGDIVEWEKGFGGDEVGYAFDEVFAYKSARAPKGIEATTYKGVLSNYEVTRAYQLGAQFLRSQDTIKIVTPLAYNYEVNGDVQP